MSESTLDALDTSLGGGLDAFLTKLTRSGTRLAHSTYLRGSDSDSGADVTVDLRGNAYVTGQTSSSDFRTTPGAYDPTFNGDAFVSKITAR